MSAENEKKMEILEIDTPKETKQSTLNLYFEKLPADLQEFLRDPSNIHFYYQILIILSGFFLFKMFANGLYELPLDIWAILIWFILIMMYPLPKKLRSEYAPFA